MHQTVILQLANAGDVLPIAKVLQILGATIFLLCCGAKLR
jgi:hypothetical protein